MDLFEHASLRTAQYPDGVPPTVCDLFEQLALEIKKNGFDRYSARAILHRIRWHWQIEKGDRGFKANNNWTPAMARWLMSKDPATFDGFFETRELL